MRLLAIRIAPSFLTEVWPTCDFEQEWVDDVREEKRVKRWLEEGCNSGDQQIVVRQMRCSTVRTVRGRMLVKRIRV